MALNTYISQTQTILHDFNGVFYGSPLNLTSIINTARNKVALKGQCIRVLPPSSSSVATFTKVAGGSGYTSNPTITVSGPDVPNSTQATATAVVSGGVITAINIAIAGNGYVNTPTVTITDTTGVGASYTASLLFTPMTTTSNQEVYNFSAFNSLVARTSGVATIQEVLSVSVSYGTKKPSLRYLPFAQFQAYCRIFNNTQQNYPSFWSQYSKGANGSIYVFEVPTGTYQMEWDCACLPIALATDSDPEAIPYPWTDAVQYYAAHLCYEYAQRSDDAARMLAKFNQKMMEANTESTPPRFSDMYSDDGED